GLAQSAHPQVDLGGIHVEMLADASAGSPKHTHRVRFVDHEEGLVPFLDLDEARKIRNIAMNAVDPLDGNQNSAVSAPHLAEQRVQGSPVVVGKGPPRGPGQDTPLHDAVVDERVVNDQILRAKQMTDGGHIGRMPADVDDAILGSKEARQLRLELSVERL